MIPSDDDKEVKSATFISKVLTVLGDSKRKIYYEACVRFVYQYFDKFTTNDKIPQNIFKEQVNLSLDEMREITCEYKLRVLQVVMAFCDAFGIGWEEAVDHQVADYFKLALMLKRKQLANFQICFEEFLRKSSKAVGEYYKVALKNEVRLLFMIATRRKFHKTRNLIFKKFPYIDIRSTAAKEIYDTQDFNFLIIDGSLETILKSLNGKLYSNYVASKKQTKNGVNVALVDVERQKDYNKFNLEKLLESLHGGFWRTCEFL